MRVVFACYVYDFHKQFCVDIAEEIIRRGGKVIFSKKGESFDADFTIQPDEIYHRQGGKGIWINHAMPVIPQNAFYLGDVFKSDLTSRSDYIFTFSKEWAEWHQMFGLPVYVTGYPRLDKLFGNLHKDGTVLYAPTHHLKNEVYSGDEYPIDKIKKACLDVGYKDFIYREHPAFHKNEIGLNEAYKRASLVISDYSSVGLEAITLNIPTILIGNQKWKDVNNNHISSKSDVATMRVYDWESFQDALELYRDNPDYLERERIEYSKKLCEYQGCAAKKTVDILEGLL